MDSQFSPELGDTISIKKTQVEARATIAVAVLKIQWYHFLAQKWTWIPEISTVYSVLKTDFLRPVLSVCLIFVFLFQMKQKPNKKQTSGKRKSHLNGSKPPE